MGLGPDLGLGDVALESLTWPWSAPPAAVPQPAAAPIDPAAAAAPSAPPPPAGQASAIPPPVTDELQGAPGAAPSVSPPLDAGQPAPPAPAAAGLPPGMAPQLGPVPDGAPPLAPLSAPAFPPAPLPPIAPVAAGPAPLAPYGAPIGPQPPRRVRDMPGIEVVDHEPPASPFDERDPEVRRRRLVELAQRDPGAFAELVAQHDDERQKIADTQRLANINRDWDQQRQNLRDKQNADRITRQKTEMLLADAQRIADTKIDPAGGVHGGRLVAGVIASVIGGLVQGRTGAANNAGLDALNHAIARGIEAQRADLANQRENIGLRKSLLYEEYTQHGDDYRAAEAMRLAAYKHADDLLAVEQQNYDRGGTTDIKIAGLRAGVASAQQQAVQAFQQRTFDNQIKLMTAEREARTAAETLRHNRASEGIDWARINQQKLDREEARNARLQAHADTQADKESERLRQFSIGGQARVQMGHDGKPVIGDDGKPVVTNGPLLNRDGKPWMAASPEAHAKISDKMTAAGEVISMIDEVLAIRARVGGESKLLNSDERQRLDVLQHRIVILTKSGTQGMSSDEDMTRLQGAAGADNISSWRSQEAKLKEARGRIEGEFNRTMRVAKYDGPPIVFANPYAEVKNTPDDDQLKDLMQKPSRSYAELRDERIRELEREDEAKLSAPSVVDDPFAGQSRRPAPRSQAEIDAALKAGASERADRAVADTNRIYIEGADPEQQRRIAQLGSLARGKVEWDGNVPKNDAARAIVQLRKISESADTAALRRLASHEIEMAALSAGGQ